jgi:Skp family chaperone for outer membrane proteins
MWLKSLPVVLLILWVGSAKAESGQVLIAVVDVQRIVHDSKAGNSIQVQYDKQRQAFSDQVAASESELDTREQELSRQRTVLSADAFNAQRQALEAHSAEIQEQIQKESQDNQSVFNDAFAELVSNIRHLVSMVAKEKNIAVVLSQEQVLYLGDNAIDITDIVLGRLNDQLPSIAITLPQTAAIPALKKPEPTKASGKTQESKP